MRFSEFNKTSISESIRQLYEVNMSPSNLRNFANSELGQSATAGFEAELIFPDMSFLKGKDKEGDGVGGTELEDQDFTNVESAVDFFYNDGISTNKPRSAIASIVINILRDIVRVYLEDNQDELIRDAIALPDVLEMMLGDHKRVYEFFLFEGISTSEIPDEYKDNDGKLIFNDELYAYLVDEYEDEVVQYISDNIDELDSAREQIYELAKERSLENVTMRDIFQLQPESDGESTLLSWPVEYDIPNATSDTFDFESKVDYSAILNKFLEETDGFGYHAEQNKDGDYTIWNFTYDSSIDLVTGIEIVSPAMPLGELLEIIPRFFEWAKRNGATATSETGFHMSVSFPNYNRDTLDFMKLALFLGDTYVLDQFKRYGTSATKSTLEDIAKRSVTYGNKSNAIRTLSVPNSIFSLSELLRSAADDIVKYRSDRKMFSIHPKRNYVEFRSVGNVGYFDDIQKLQYTLLRYAYALSIALNPEAETKEYAKKIYQFLNSIGFSSALGVDRTKVFALYSSGQITADQLKMYFKKSNDDDAGQNRNFAQTQQFVVKIDNPYFEQLPTNVKREYIESSVMDVSGATFQYILPEIRKQLKSFLDLSLGQNDLPVVIDKKTGRSEPFDPMNKRHLPDRDIQYVRIK